MEVGVKKISNFNLGIKICLQSDKAQLKFPISSCSPLTIIKSFITLWMMIGVECSNYSALLILQSILFVEVTQHYMDDPWCRSTWLKYTQFEWFCGGKIIFSKCRCLHCALLCIYDITFIPIRIKLEKYLIENNFLYR